MLNNELSNIYQLKGKILQMDLSEKKKKMSI